MTKHKQVLFGYGQGDCLRTCIASILDKPLEDVPNFCVKDSWFEDMVNWCYGEGVGVLYQARKSPPNGLMGCYAIATGRSPRWRQMAEQHPDVDPELFLHCVVVRIGRYGEGCDWVHDPHPDNTWIDDVRYWIILIPNSSN